MVLLCVVTPVSIVVPSSPGVLNELADPGCEEPLAVLSPSAASYLCWGWVYLSSLANCSEYLQIFCTGVSRKLLREMSVIFCSSQQASRKYMYWLSLVSQESSMHVLGWLLEYSE